MVSSWQEHVSVVMSARLVLLEGGSPWGFRMTGGCDTGAQLRISRVGSCNLIH